MCVVWPRVLQKVADLSVDSIQHSHVPVLFTTYLQFTIRCLHLVYEEYASGLMKNKLTFLSG